MANGHGSADRMGTDQAARLRELMRRRSASATTLAVTSGKGGVGKSNVAVNLSICLAAKGLRVVLADVDMGLANADLLMDLKPRYTLSHVLSGVRSIREVCTEGPGGIRFVPGTSGLHSMADLSEFDRQNLIKQLKKLKNDADIVVLDCGAGISHNVLSFALASDYVLVVTTPQPTALTDAYAMIKALHREGCAGGIRLLVNMVHSRAEAEASYRRLAQVARRFLNYSVADSGYMLHDTAVELAVQERCPFVIRYPGSNASACIAAMASDMTRSYAGQPGRGGFFKRVVGLFV
jgi:flagellar biosynthesis protein FlhG